MSTVTLESLAEEFHYSASYLCRYIKKATGKNFSQVIRSIKLQRVGELLQKSDLTVNEITTLVGYESQSYLSRAFRSEYGVTPQQYRKNSGLRS